MAGIGFIVADVIRESLNRYIERQTPSAE